MGVRADRQLRLADRARRGLAAADPRCRPDQKIFDRRGASRQAGPSKVLGALAGAAAAPRTVRRARATSRTSSIPAAPCATTIVSSCPTQSRDTFSNFATIEISALLLRWDRDSRGNRPAPVDEGDLYRSDGLQNNAEIRHPSGFATGVFAAGGQRNLSQVMALGALAEYAGRIIAAHIQQAEFQQHHGGLKGGRDGQRGMAGVGNASLDCPMPRNMISMSSTTRYLIDDQDSQRFRGSADCPPSFSQVATCCASLTLQPRRPAAGAASIGMLLRLVGEPLPTGGCRIQFLLPLLRHAVMPSILGIGSFRPSLGLDSPVYLPAAHAAGVSPGSVGQERRQAVSFIGGLPREFMT